MNFSRFRHIFRSKQAKTAAFYVASIGGTFTVFYSLQDLRYEKDRLKKMSVEKASKVLQENNLLAERKKLEEEQRVMKDRVKDDYEMIPIDKPEFKEFASTREAQKRISEENALTFSFTKAASLRADVETLMELTRKRFKGGPNESMKYKILQEHKGNFEEHLINSQILVNEIKKNLERTVDKENLDLGKEIKRDVENLIELINNNLSDIDKLLTKLGKGL